MVSNPPWIIWTNIKFIFAVASVNSFFEFTNEESQRAVSIFRPRTVCVSLVAEVSAVNLGIGLVYCILVILNVARERCTVKEHIIRRCHLVRRKLVARIDYFQTITLFEHRRHVYHVARVEARQIDRLQTVAMIKHFEHVLDIDSREVVPEVYRLQFFTIRKHFCHVLYFRCIEIRHIKLRTTGIIKHGTHICYIPGVEMRYVKLCYFWNITERAIHISHIPGVEMRHVKLCYFCKFMKHVFHIRHFRSVQIL